MKVFIDANLFIYLNTVVDPYIRELYENFYIDLLSKYKAYTDVLVLDELIYVSKKKYSIPYSVTLEFINTIIRPYVAILPLREEEFDYASSIIKDYNLKPSDALHIGVMKTNNIELIASEDTEFDKIRDIKRVWINM